MAYARSLSGTQDSGYDMQQDTFADVRRPANLPDWAYSVVTGGMAPAEERALVAFGAPPPRAFTKILKREMRKRVRTPNGRQVPARPPGTRLYIPGYLGDQEQAAVDME